MRPMWAENGAVIEFDCLMRRTTPLASLASPYAGPIQRVGRKEAEEGQQKL
jgi:hypothetical protein